MNPAPTAARPLRLQFIASPALAAAIVFAHSAAAYALLTVLTGWPGMMLAALVVLLGGLAAWDRALLGFRTSPKSIELHADGSAKCLFANGESAVLEQEGAGLVSRYWVAIRLRSHPRRSLLAVAGMLAPAEFRILRLWALWGRVPGQASRQLVEGGV